MAKKKSLGSSPIGYKSSNGSKMDFIPDLGVSKPSRESSQQKKSKPKEETAEDHKNGEEKSTEKKIVSYNLEVDLIDKIKYRAKEKDMYYSSFVSKVLKSWLAENG